MSNKASNCVVHFGLAKTGSSAIQKYLFDNKSVLEKQGILFPGTEANHFHFQSLFSGNPSSLLQVRRLGLHGPAELHAFLDGFKVGIERQIAEVKPRMIVLSSEYFTSMVKSELMDLRNYLMRFADTVTSIAYVRDPWTFATSYIQQSIQDGKLKEEVKIGYLESNIELLELISSVFGDKCIVRPYCRDAHEPFNVVGDFLQTLGIVMPDDVHLQQSLSENESIGARLACLLIHFNKLNPQYGGDGLYVVDKPRDWILEALRESISDDRPIKLSSETARMIYESAWSDLDKLHKRYFGGDDVFFRFYQRQEFCGGDHKISLNDLEKTDIAAALFGALDVLAARAIGLQEWARAAEAEHLYFRALCAFREGNTELARCLLKEVLTYQREHASAQKMLAELGEGI